MQPGRCSLEGIKKSPLKVVVFKLNHNERITFSQMKWGEDVERWRCDYSKQAAIKCKSTERKECKKGKVRGRVTVDAAGEVGRGCISGTFKPW